MGIDWMLRAELTVRAPMMTPARVQLARSITEEALGELIRDACAKFGWRFLWLRKTRYGSAGILDLTLIPLRDLTHRHTLHRELKGYDARGRLGRTTAAQDETIRAMLAAGDDAGVWTPDDWVSGRIERKLMLLDRTGPHGATREANEAGTARARPKPRQTTPPAPHQAPR